MAAETKSTAAKRKPSTRTTVTLENGLYQLLVTQADTNDRPVARELDRIMRDHFTAAQAADIIAEPS